MFSKKKYKKIYFRADAGPTIGYGHFVRSLALADMLKNDFECTFFTQNPSEYQQQEVSKVCRCVSLPSDERKFEEFLAYLTGNEIVVLDNYFYTTEYQKSIKKIGCKLVCIDDIHDRHFYADVVVNHGSKKASNYSTESTTSLCIGGEWALLRSPFLSKDSTTTRESKHWVLSFGGSDPYNLTLLYVKYLLSSLPDCKISLLLGDGYAYFDTVESIPNLTVYRRQSAEQVAALFRSAECVLCSASSVCYEALACGARVFAGYYVDNQVDFYQNLAENGLICPLGDLRTVPPMLDLDYKGKCNMRFEGIEERYKMLFHALSFTVLDYPAMTQQQSYSTWQCRNRGEIRKWMTNPDPFSFESHCSFVEGLKLRPDKLYYAFFDDETFIGSYDFVDIRDGETSEHGLFVNPDYQGHHVAAMMELLMDGVIAKRGVKTLLAEVIKNNEPSLRYHLKVGYVIYKEDERYFYLKREL